MNDGAVCSTLFQGNVTTAMHRKYNHFNTQFLLVQKMAQSTVNPWTLHVVSSSRSLLDARRELRAQPSRRTVCEIVKRPRAGRRHRGMAFSVRNMHAK